MTPTTTLPPLAVRQAAAARMLGISIRHLRDLTHRGEIKAKVTGRRLLYPISELERYLATAN